MDIRVVEFQKHYKTINLDMMNNNPKEYDKAIIIVHTLETENGYVVKKIGKTYKNGTQITYKPIESRNEAEKYSSKVRSLIEGYNIKYRTENSFTNTTIWCGKKV